MSSARDVSNEPVTQLEFYQVLDAMAKEVSQFLNEQRAAIDALSEASATVLRMADLLSSGATVEKFIRDEGGTLAGKIAFNAR